MPEPRAQTIAVLGGGISGLTAAFTLSRRLPRDQYRIIVAEASSRLGGPGQSERISVLGEDGPRALYEWGPRSIRPVGYKGRRTIELVRSDD